VYEIFAGGISGIATISYVSEEINPKTPVTIIDVINAIERFFPSILMYVKSENFLLLLFCELLGTEPP